MNGSHFERLTERGASCLGNGSNGRTIKEVGSITGSSLSMKSVGQLKDNIHNKVDKCPLNTHEAKAKHKYSKNTREEQ